MLKLFKKKESRKDTSDQHLTLRVAEVIRETDDATTIIFENPDENLEYLPGQYLTLILPDGTTRTRRAYSICSSPDCDDAIGITVKRVDEGKVSNYLNDHMKVGDTFEVLKPMGNFTPSLDPQHSGHYVLIGGGSGITPLMSILKSVLAMEPLSKITLIYQNRNEDTIIFKDAIDKLVREYQERLHAVHVLSRPGAGWEGHAGRLNKALFEQILQEEAVDSGKAEFYICGPSGMMETAKGALADLNVPAKNIRTESFVASPVSKETAPAGEEAIETRTVTITLDNEEHEVLVPAGKSILEAALDQGLNMPFSCQSGLCTACRGKLLRGRVYMEEDDGLTEDEIEEGYVLNCVGHPMTDDVKVEIG
jgi:ring-1,2-phenylacetyl-CoA epoxidase subunit PaaE